MVFTRSSSLGVKPNRRILSFSVKMASKATSSSLGLAVVLIEQCGFKGKNHGPVGVYEKQALVLVNLGDARGHEIALVAESIRTAVKDRFGIELMPEVKYVG